MSGWEGLLLCDGSMVFVLELEVWLDGVLRLVPGEWVCHEGEREALVSSMLAGRVPGGDQGERTRSRWMAASIYRSTCRDAGCGVQHRRIFSAFALEIFFVLLCSGHHPPFLEIPAIASSGEAHVI
jgi:hypothetical protein